LTSLVGRETEITGVSDLLGDPAVRLLTLTGPGGMGKTRLALAVAERVVPDFPDGVVFVPLAPLGDPTFVPSGIAQRLGVREVAGQTLAERLTTHLVDKQMLVILDNFEHLLPAAPFVTELLTACPGLKALVTSRAPLHLSGEHIFPVPPLSLPDPGQLPLLQELAQTEAVRLFVDRAQALKPGFVLTDENAPAVAEIVRRLDGLPLALELAAARVPVLSPAALLARLDRRLPLLTGGVHDLPERQRTLRNTISWSYDLLPPHEQALFRRLAVFAGGCTLEAVEAVAGPEMDPAIDALDGLMSLVDKSLLRTGDDPDDEPRFGMLETVREFGLEQLDAVGETDEIRRRQGAYYVAMAVRTHPVMSGSYDDRRWLDLLEAEDDNLWSVLSWSLESGEIEVGLRLANRMFLYWYMRTRRLTEARAWLDRGLEQDRLGGASDGVLAPALICASALAHLQDDVGRAQTMAEDALAIFERIGPPRDVAWAHYILAIPVYMQGDCSRAEQLYQEAVEQFLAEGDRWWVAEALLGLAHIAVDHGDYQRAAAVYEESLQLSQQVGSSSCAASAKSGLGFLARRRGDPVTAHRLFQESLAVWDEIDDPASVVVCLEAIAATACSLGAPFRAAQLLGAAEALRERMGYPIPRGALLTYQQTVAGIQSSLSMIQFSTAWLEGRGMSGAEAIALSREELPIPDAWSTAERRQRSASPSSLTPREIEVLRLLAQGFTDREIAEVLFVSRRTASDHVGHILRKLDVRSRADAAVFSVRHGLV
jgi:non-specific serine/threonine protein kinase